MGFLKSDVEKAIVQLKAEIKAELIVDVYNEVGKKIIAETHAKEKEVQRQLEERLTNWDIMLDTHIQTKVVKEWDLIKKTKP